MPKNDAKSNLTLFTKINTEWIKKLNVRAKTIRLLEENTSLNLRLITPCFLRYDTKSTNIKEKKKGKLDLKPNLLCFKEYYQKRKNSP